MSDETLVHVEADSARGSGDCVVFGAGVAGGWGIDGVVGVAEGDVYFVR